jgi:hypothetical protein
MRELKCHPDLGGSNSEAALLNEAYNVLSNPALREKYDERLFGSQSKKSLSAKSPQDRSETTPSSPPCPFCKLPVCDETGGGRYCICGGSLHSSGKRSFQQLTRRTLSRMKRNGSILYVSQGSEKPKMAEIVDLSPAGMRFLCTQRLLPGNTLKISSADFSATAVVKNICEQPASEQKKFTVGVEFLTVEFYASRGSFLSTSA